MSTNGSTLEMVVAWGKYVISCKSVLFDLVSDLRICKAWLAHEEPHGG